MKKISIITVNYNNDLGLEATIKSVINQSFKNFEFIIIDGNSTDNSKAIIEIYAKNITFWVSEPDNGIYHAMNKGIEKTTGEYLLFLNSGDRLVDNEILENVALKLNANTDIFYGDIIYEEPEKPTRIATFPTTINFNYLYNFSLSHQASFINKSLFKTVGLYNENYKIVSDWEFFILAIFKYHATYQHLNLVVAKYDGAGISSNTANHPAMYKERETTLRTHFKDFVKDNNLLNQFQNKKIKQLLYLKNNHSFSWKLIKGLLKIIWIFLPKEKRNYENML